MLPSSGYSPQRRDRIGLREAVLASHDFGTLLGEVTAAVEQVFASEAVASVLLLRHSMSREARQRVERRGNLLFHTAPAPAGSSLEEHLLQLGRIGLIATHLREYCLASGCDQPAYSASSAVYLPLFEGREGTGVILVLLRDPMGTLSGGAEQVLADLQNAAQIALPSCRELESLRTLKDNMQEIFEAATLLEAGEDPMLVARSACEVMTERLGFDRAALFLFCPRMSDLECYGSSNFEHLNDGIHLEISSRRSLIAESFLEASVRWLPIVPNDPTGVADIEGAKWFHGVVLPLLNEGRAVGVLYGDHRVNHVQVTPSRLVNLQLFANTVAGRVENAQLLRQVAKLADQDGLTQLSNRRAFDTMLRREVARAQRTHTPLSLLMIDVDKFKELNDGHGHLAGDEVLIATAQVLLRCVRETDFVARYGGDEFIVLMPNSDSATAQRVMNRIVEAVAEAGAQLNRDRWHYHLSIGMRSTAPEETELLLQRADAALYEQKETKVRRSLLEVLAISTDEELLEWNHYLGKLMRVLIEKEAHALSHARRVARYCQLMAKALNLSTEQTEAICLAAMLHDVGKISIPGAILQKTGPLTPQEYRTVQTHPRIGDDLLREVNYLGDVCLIVRHHHERYDGKTTGDFPAYPAELTGDDIPIGARIVKIADSFDAMTSPRPWRPSLRSSKARQILEDEAGRAFDPELVKTFFQVAKEISDGNARPLRTAE